MTERRRLRSFIAGPTGETVFDEPFRYHFRDLDPMNLYAKVKALNDDRLRAVVGAIALEEQLDRCLAALMPGFGDFVKVRDVTLSLKIGMLKALRLVPIILMREADILRKIRNEFAHNLSVDRFESLPFGHLSDLRHVAEDAYAQTGLRDTLRTESPSQLFDRVQFHCLVGLEAYEHNLHALREHIEEPEFVTALRDGVEAENVRSLQALTAQTPERVEVHGPVLFKHYPNSVVLVESNPDFRGEAEASARSAERLQDSPREEGSES